MIASDQATAPQTLLWAGAPSHSERMASTMMVNGFTSANPRSTSGIDATGTNAEEMNVSGNTAMNASELAASGVETSIPMNAKTHENAYPNRSSSPKPATPSATLVWKENPISSPVMTRIVAERALVTTSASVRPASTAGRVMGSERKRSISPLWRSSFNPSAVTNPPK